MNHDVVHHHRQLERWVVRHQQAQWLDEQQLEHRGGEAITRGHGLLRVDRTRQRPAQAEHPRCAI
eukprot:3857999-Pyramimonas_sp.AAC.1